MRTITAPGVEIKEIDKSQYSPAMVGTACYVMGFANKGEAYIPMEFTSRAAWLSYYGEPDTEAEKYFYNACTEVLNQNGRLYCARLPYDNTSFEKMIGYTFTVGDTKDLTAIYGTDDKAYKFDEIRSLDASIDKAIMINATSVPQPIELSKVDEYRTDESKVANDTFLIVDKTCSPYKKIQEDTRKGKNRELLGIVPVVTTAANAMYAQKLISVPFQSAKWYESIGYCNTQLSGNAGIYAGSAEANIEDNPNRFNTDLVRQLNSTYKNYAVRQSSAKAAYDSVRTMQIGLKNCIDINNEKFATTSVLDVKLDGQIRQWIDAINGTTYDGVHTPGLVDNLIEYWKNDKFLKDLVAEKGFDQLKIFDNDTVGSMSNKIASIYEAYNTVADWHAQDFDDALPETVSFEANEFFSTIQYDASLSAFDRENLKKIGVVVYKTYIDPGEGNKIAFEPVEAFVGSLYKNDKDINTGITTFIDTIINTQSNYIYFFSNCFNSGARKLEYLNDLDIFIMKATPQSGILGFFEEQVTKSISVPKSIYDGMEKCFTKVADVNERDIDIVPDAGIANIASFIKSIGTDAAEYDLNACTSDGTSVVQLWKVDKAEATKTWKAVEQKFDQFCKNVRKDCMFIADGLRPLVIDGQKKKIRSSKPKNNIDVDILPYVKYMTGLNTNYGAGYCDWFEVADEFTGDFFWCPPSIKAMGIYIYTDSNFNYWDAPAGLNRGVVAATDVAFSPTGKQAGAIYEKNWNYAINYPQDGIVLEGQKTFQVKPSAFDRVNVRRLFLRLERAAYKVARYFVYEGNTAYTRQRLVDALNPYFKEAKVGGGVYDYKIICDESINTSEVIDRNELKVKIGIKPTKTAEFILIDFIALTTGGSFEEAMA